LPRQNDIYYVEEAESGGDNSVTEDIAEKYGLQIPILSNGTKEKMKPILLAGMPSHNPVDYGGTAEENPDVITRFLRTCMEEALSELDDKYKKPFTANISYAREPIPPPDILHKETGIPVIELNSERI
jgi:hypothetical protein